MEIVKMIISVLRLLIAVLGYIHTLRMDRKRAATTTNSDGSVTEK